jgi:hypothetical protein
MYCVIRLFENDTDAGILPGGYTVISQELTAHKPNKV